MAIILSATYFKKSLHSLSYILSTLSEVHKNAQGSKTYYLCFPGSYLSGCSNNSGAGSNRPELTQPLSPTLMASIPCEQRFLSCIAFSIYKVVRLAFLSCSWFVYAPGRKRTTTTRQNQAPLLIFAHAQETKFGLICKMFFMRIYFDLFYLLSFSRSFTFLHMQFCCPLYRLSFA